MSFSEPSFCRSNSFRHAALSSRSTLAHGPVLASYGSVRVSSLWHLSLPPALVPKGGRLVVARLRGSRGAEEAVGGSERRAWEQALGSSYDMAKCKMRRFLQHNTLRLLRDLMTVCVCLCVWGVPPLPPISTPASCLALAPACGPGQMVTTPTHSYYNHAVTAAALEPLRGKPSPPYTSQPSENVS